MRLRLLQLALMAILAAASLGGARAVTALRPTASVAALSNPLMLATRMPIAPGLSRIGAGWANGRPGTQTVGRGAVLWIRYSDGTLKNLTTAAGYGSSDPSGFQGASASAVRDPGVSWDG